MRVFYSFNFIGGGINQVFADTAKEAISKAKSEYATTNLKVDEKTFIRRDTRELQDSYYRGLPNID